MNEGSEWRRYITIWVAAICVTVVAYGWLMRPSRFHFAGQGLAFDKYDGRLYSALSGERTE